MLFHTRSVVFQNKQKGRILWPKQAWLASSPRKHPYFIASHNFDMNLEMLYSFLPGYSSINTLGLLSEKQQYVLNASS